MVKHSIIDLEFKVNGYTYTGEATPRYDNGTLLWYEIELYSGLRFTIEKNAGEWKSDFENIDRKFFTPCGECIDKALKNKAE